MKPRLLFSELSGMVYLVTRYSELSGTVYFYSIKPHPTKAGRAIFIAHRKVDVTEDFDAVAGPRRRHLVRESRKPSRKVRKG